jgi:cytochrome P450
MIDDRNATDLGDHAMMLTMDPPRHTQYRKLASPRFLRSAAGRMRPGIERLAAEIVDGVADRDEFDLVDDVAGLLPSYVIAEMLGIPRQDGVELYRLTETLHADPASQPDGAGLAAVTEMFNYANGVWKEKRAHPGDDLASALVMADIDGYRLDEIDFNLIFPPAHRRWRRHDPQPGGRRDGRALHAPRRARATDCRPRASSHGHAFDEPERFDITRMPNDHLAFGGGGPHFCLGSHVARVEIDAMFRQLLTRLPDLQKIGETEWLPSTFISGPKHIGVLRRRT